MAHPDLRRVSFGHFEDLKGRGRVIATKDGLWQGVTPQGRRSQSFATMEGAHRWLRLAAELREPAK